MKEKNEYRELGNLVIIQPFERIYLDRRIIEMTYEMSRGLFIDAIKVLK